jgi:DNA (cytosine-5)-methyltransferase 1
MEQPTREQMGQSRQPWEHFDVVHCLDGKARRVEPGTFPLAHGIPARMGKLRAYGNAIVPQVAAQFVAAYMDVVAMGR